MKKILTILFITFLICNCSYAFGFRSGKIQVYFVDATKNKTPSNTCNNECCKSLLNLINSANESIDFAIYGIGSQDAIFNALVNAQKRGVKIRWVTDVDETFQNIYNQTFPLMECLKNVKVDFETTKALQKDYEEKTKDKIGENAGRVEKVEYTIDGKTLTTFFASKQLIEHQKGIMHDKFFIFDKKTVWTGSANVSSTDLQYNSNVIVIIDDKNIASLYQKEFNQMYEQEKFHDLKTKINNTENILLDKNTVISVYFTPSSRPLKNAVYPLIQNAKSSIDIAMFYFTDRRSMQYLLDAASRGVKVRVIVDATGASSEYSKHEILRAGGIKVKVENFGGKMHQKTAIIDNRYIVAGSMNWTGNGEFVNDENTVVIDNLKIAHFFTKEFNNLFKAIPDKWLTSRPNAESLDSVNSCYDGIDNDFDDKIDFDDEGCRVNAPKEILPATNPTLKEF